MNQTRNFRTEYEAFIQKYPYKTVDVNGIKVRYQYGGKKDAPVLLFFHGLEMQEMWTAYALHYEKDYRFLNYEYPLHTASIDKQMEFAYAWHQKTGWLPLAFLSAPGILRRLSEFRCVFVELNFVFIYYASGMQLYSK